MASLGRYRLDQVLGSGSFATVWRGYDPELDVVVAVKVLADNWSLDADVRARFLAEARLLRRISSDRVVRVHDVGIADDRPYFVMDHVGGGSLADRVGSLEPAEAVRLTVEAAYAVQVLHDAGVVHRDVKPGNLLLDTTDPPRVLVADLGSAKLLADASGYTVTTGTPAYMAPEQAGLDGGFDGRADVYALAVVGYELLGGRRPFDVPAATGTGPGARRDDPSPVAAPRGLPGAVDAVLASGLRLDPTERPADARELADALVRASGDVGPARSGRSWPAWIVVVVAVVLFVVSALVVSRLR
ncbi:serine/threonine-protein kinase [Microlunatus antarcticus]|uniref:non-specific serine/threonine protein kinase n=1 Tax=Microlunatus antarcticus TaxID=53388 RepID=A0A7W5JSE8_9ACTN|nr:serine/threonine protein kinase [Microlunatus antarcticus]